MLAELVLELGSVVTLRWPLEEDQPERLVGVLAWEAVVEEQALAVDERGEGADDSRQSRGRVAAGEVFCPWVT